MGASISIMMAFIIFIVLLVPPIIRWKAKGKLLVYFIEDDGHLTVKLKAPQYNNEYVVDKEGAYDICPGADYMGLTSYGPLHAFFQTSVPYCMYERDNPTPRPIRNSMIKPISSKVIKAGLEPHFLVALSSSSREGSNQTRLQKMMPILMLGTLAIAVILMLVLYTKFGSMAAALAGIKATLGGG